MKQTNEALDVSVVVCTRNRARQLGQFLQSMAELQTPDGLAWEVLIVDNGSSDETPDVIRGFADRLPISSVREETPGLSNARNRGVDEARGAYICWTDDDVLVDPQWLAAYVDAFKRHPDAVIFGGRILPHLEAPVTPWFDELKDTWPLTNLLAKRDFGDEETPLSLANDLMPWGANYAIRAAEQRSLRYDPSLGVSPDQRRLGEEADVLFRLSLNGAKGWWVPGSKVHHLIPASRQSLEYIVQYFRSHGETLAYLDSRDDPRASGQVRGSPADLKARACSHYLGFGLWHALGRRWRSINHLRLYAIYKGAAEFKEMSRRAS